MVSLAEYSYSGVGGPHGAYIPFSHPSVSQPGMSGPRDNGSDGSAYSI
jgi:hypothetical protein